MVPRARTRPARASHATSRGASRRRGGTGRGRERRASPWRRTAARPRASRSPSGGGGPPRRRPFGGEVASREDGVGLRVLDAVGAPGEAAERERGGEPSRPPRASAWRRAARARRRRRRGPVARTVPVKFGSAEAPGDPHVGREAPDRTRGPRPSARRAEGGRRTPRGRAPRAGPVAVDRAPVEASRGPRRRGGSRRRPCSSSRATSTRLAARRSPRLPDVEIRRPAAATKASSILTVASSGPGAGPRRLERAPSPPRWKSAR